MLLVTMHNIVSTKDSFQNDKYLEFDDASTIDAVYQALCLHYDVVKIEADIEAFEKFKKYAPHLKDFLYEYGNDSGNVPSCG